MGLVSHLFQARGARTLGSRLESLHLNGALRAGTAAMAGLLGIPCVVGKSILASREALNAIGGIEALRDHLAEDYLLGRLVSEAGYRVVLSGDEIETAEVSRTLGAAWSRQRRWAILRKRLGKASYAAELLASPLPWFAGAVVAARGDAATLTAAAALYLLRLGLEGAASAWSRCFRAPISCFAPGPRSRRGGALLGGTLRAAEPRGAERPLRGTGDPDPAALPDRNGWRDCRTRRRRPVRESRAYGRNVSRRESCGTAWRPRRARRSRSVCWLS